MTNVDQFESVFRSAAKEIFAYEAMEIESVLVVTDRSAYDARLFADGVRSFLHVLGGDGDGPVWHVVDGEAFGTVRELLDLVEERQPDLICTYRNLHSEGWKWPFTLGDHLEVLTQATATPVVAMPRPEVVAMDAGAGTRSVMAITDHLSGDHALVNAAIRFTAPGGTLVLSHVEDERVFERYIAVISKISTIDTDLARVELRKQLLKEPHDYVGTCRTVIEERKLPVTVAEVVALGHRLSHYKALVEEHHVDLLVFNTKDEDQSAMHGLAYPLAIELRHVPTLLL